ncbi:MAG: zinc dependent phospholipase C family protein [Chloroflexi bacterium]|nr:zinc dependent phospholipase C family protein [Chloroflexota bacterium]
MPNLPAHVALAWEAARRLNDDAVNKWSGAFLLGSTTPDIRAMTKWTRDETHFAPLESTDVADGITGLFQAQPQLARRSQVSDSTCAFLLGYVTHLVADQCWITEIYRPYFANQAVYEDQVEAKVLDRALQLELDRQSTPLVKDFGALLANSEQGIDVGFISPSTLEAWRQWVEGMLAREFTWERLRIMAGRRQEPQAHPAAQQAAERFLRSVPHGLDRIFQQLPWGRIEEYKEHAVQEFLRWAKGYLECA